MTVIKSDTKETSNMIRMTDMARKMSAWILLSHDFDSWSQNLGKVYTLNSKMSFQRGEKFKEEEDITSEIFQVASLLVYTHRYRHIRVEDFRELFSIRFFLANFPFEFSILRMIYFCDMENDMKISNSDSLLWNIVL